MSQRIPTPSTKEGGISYLKSQDPTKRKQKQSLDDTFRTTWIVERLFCVPLKRMHKVVDIDSRTETSLASLATNQLRRPCKRALVSDKALWAPGCTEKYQCQCQVMPYPGPGQVQRRRKERKRRRKEKERSGQQNDRVPKTKEKKNLLVTAVTGKTRPGNLKCYKRRPLNIQSFPVLT